MPAQKRQRQRSSRAQQAATLAARRRSTRRRAVAVALFLVLLLVLGVASIVGGNSGSSSKTTDTTAAAAAGTCPQANPPQRKFSAPPPMTIDAAKTYTAQMTTSQGTMDIALDAKKAPLTVNNFVFLARARFFDCLDFHRVVPGFVAQGGSPSGDSSGDVGYKFADELPQQGEYKVGSVVMANSGPNTNGSQFFVVTGPQGAALPPKYSLFGQVTQGLDVVSKIDALGTTNDPNTPTEPVTIESVTIKES